MLNGYHIESELDVVLKNDYFESPLGYNTVDWFLDEVIKLEIKIAFFLKKFNKDIKITEEKEQVYRNNIMCRFFEKEILSDEVRNHCQLTGKTKGPANSKCKINVSQKQSNFLPFFFHNFSNYDCHLFF